MLEKTVPFPLISIAGTGTRPPKRLTLALLARGRAPQPTRVLQRLEHFSETLVLDRKAVAQLRTREHDASAENVEDLLDGCLRLMENSGPQETGPINLGNPLPARSK